MKMTKNTRKSWMQPFLYKSPIKSKREHAIKRYKERYGSVLSIVEYKNAIKRIKAEKGEYLGKLSESRKLWRIKVYNSLAIAIYDKVHKVIVTFITEKMFNKINGLIPPKE